MRNKKTRSLKESIIYYIRIILYSIFIILTLGICWSFGNMFDSNIWLFLMGTLFGFLITYPFTKSKNDE